jgi:replication factor C subunit 3/5
MTDFLPWVEKYRPNKFDDFIGNEQNVKTIRNMLKAGSLPHLLFYGTSGTGKTSIIITIAKELYGNNMNLMVMKLDASDDRGINSVREEIKGFAEKKNMFQKGIKLIILDEADSMTFDAQFALRRIIEKYSNSTRFCLICNYENKIIPAIRSRCANFRFSPIPNDKIIGVLETIAIKENINLDNDSLKIITSLSNGDLRKSINLLQSISMKDSIINSDICYELIGLPNKSDIDNIFEYLINDIYDFNQTYEKLFKIIKNNGYSLTIILKEITSKLLNCSNNLLNANIFSDLSDFENKISRTIFYDIYISGLISIFKKNCLLNDQIFKN